MRQIEITDSRGVTPQKPAKMTVWVSGFRNKMRLDIRVCLGSCVSESVCGSRDCSEMHIKKSTEVNNHQAPDTDKGDKSVNQTD